MAGYKAVLEKFRPGVKFSDIPTCPKFRECYNDGAAKVAGMRQGKPVCAFCYTLKGSKIACYSNGDILN